MFFLNKAIVLFFKNKKIRYLLQHKIKKTINNILLKYNNIEI